MISTKHIYGIKSVYSYALKVGYHCGNLEGLKARYVCAYGSSCTILMWSMSECDNARNIEMSVHRQLQAYHLENELFHDSCIPALHTICDDMNLRKVKCEPGSVQMKYFQNLDDHTKRECVKVSTLAHVINADWAPKNTSLQAKAATVKEVLSALGLSGPFDTETVVPILTTGEVRDRLLMTRAFREWKETRLLFGSKLTPTTWTAAEIGKALQGILGVVGLRLASTPTKKRVGKTRQNIYTYRLDTVEVTKMQELVALRNMDVPAAGRWAHLLKPKDGSWDDVSATLSAL